MCHFMKAHKARSWNNLNLIWFWFSASRNAPDLEMGRPPLGCGESSDASNDGTITVPEASSATPRILQEVLASGVQALEIASQITVSGWHNKLFSILLVGGGGYIEFLSFSCDNRPGHNNNVLKLNLSWCLGFQGLA